MSDNTNDLQQQLLILLDDSAIELVNRFSSAIVFEMMTEPEEQFEIMASGVLVQTFNRMYLVTAYHVIKEYVDRLGKDVRQLYFSIGKELYQFPAECIKSFNEVEEDIVVVDLSTAISHVGRLDSRHFFPLSLVEEDIFYEPDDMLIVAGYPATMNPTITNLDSFVGNIVAFRTKCSVLDEKVIARDINKLKKNPKRFDIDIHTVIPYHPTRKMIPNGMLANGLSGGGAWSFKYPTDSDFPVQQFMYNTLKLNGIVIRQAKNSNNPFSVLTCTQANIVRRVLQWEAENKRGRFAYSNGNTYKQIDGEWLRMTHSVSK